MIAQARDRAEEAAEEDEEDADQTRQAYPRRVLQRDDDRAQLERDGSLEMMLLLASSFPSLLLKSCLSLSRPFLHRCKLPLYAPVRSTLPLPGAWGNSRGGGLTLLSPAPPQRLFLFTLLNLGAGGGRPPLQHCSSLVVFR